jgi:hypothetical protein
LADDRIISVSVRLLVVWTICVVIGTLAPFDFSFASSGQGRGFKIFAYGAYERDLMHFALNLLLFVPLGSFLHHEGRRRTVSLLPIFVVAGTSAFLISATVEGLQAFVPVRNSSLVDVMANTGGALLGVLADSWCGASVETILNSLRNRTSMAATAFLMAVFLGVTLAVSAALQSQTRLSNWSADYPLLIGNEGTGDRPWRGRVLALTMSDSASDLSSVRHFAESGALVLRGATVAAFDLTGNPPFTDAVGALPNLELTQPLDASDGSAGIDAHQWLVSDGPASGLARRLRRTNAFSLLVQCATDSTDQDGPARIVSNSVSPWLRNFTLGQQGRDLVFRLRTPGTSRNGYPLELHVPGVFSDRNPRDILVTYDGATVLATAAQSNRVSRADLNPGSIAALAIPALNVRTDELAAYNLLYVTALSLVPAVLVGLLGRSRSGQRMLGAGWALAFSVLLEVTLAGTSGRAFDWTNLVVSAAVAAGVMLCVSVVISQPDGRGDLAGLQP